MKNSKGLWRFLAVPVLALLAGVLLGWFMGGAEQALTVLILALFEVTMSLDNAIVNAGVLRRLNAFWQRLFLTVGLLVAVFGMRLVMPVILVAVTAGLSPGKVTNLALHHPGLYAKALSRAYPAIAAFGGMFLLLVFLNFLIDDSKEVHWIKVIERPLARVGRSPLIPVAASLVLLAVTALTVGRMVEHTVILAGLTGLAVYLLIKKLASWLEGLGGSQKRAAGLSGMAGLGLFVYLEVLDSAFSFDGVVGAFAISDNVLVIGLGLGVGALFVRVLTVWLVRRRALERLVYLEHGAHYAVGVLAVLLAVGLAVEIPEVVTGLAGAVVVALALWSSLKNSIDPAT